MNRNANTQTSTDKDIKACFKFDKGELHTDKTIHTILCDTELQKGSLLTQKMVQLQKCLRHK